VRAALVLAVLAVAALLARLVAHFQTEWLWFHELGQEHVFWTLLANRWLPGSLAGLGTAAFLLGNLWVTERTAPADAERPGAGGTVRLRRASVSVQLVVCVGAGLLIGRSVVITDWEHILLWLHRSDFGVTDPLFHKDVGFFVFSLPLYQRVADWLLLTTAIALACAFAAHIANGGIRTTPSPIAATRAAHTHLLGLGALLLVLLAWKHRLGQLALEVPREGETLPGAGYTTVHIALPWQYVVEAVTVAAAAMFVYAAVRRSWSLPVVAVVMVAAAELVNPSILPAVVQRLLVEPQTLSRERPYLADAIGLTQRAYALDRVTERQLPANARISEGELRSNRDVLRNVQLWDADVLRGEIGQQQAIGSYYSFPNVTVDRYRRGGETQGMIVAERELDLSRLDPSGRTWANDRLAYTHGYGLVAVPAGDEGVDGEGKPRFVTSEFGAGRPPAELREPRLYYGVQPRGARPWVIARTNRAEVEKPLTAEPRERKRSYEGGGGIPMSGLARRALFALRFGELNLLLSETLGGRARMLLHRDVRDRLTHLAPFLHWDQRPEVAVVDGRVLFLAHGYTTSDAYPYSAPIEVGGKQVNYMRGSVVASVDAFSGHVTMYVTDPEDPIARAWRAAFPNLFTGESEMPADVRAHLRYPPELFDVQSRIWATYHVDDVDDFYTRVDAWKRPADVSGPIQRVGTLKTRAPDTAPSMRPAYVLARLPGDPRQEFMLTMMFTPYSEENLTGYLAGSVDARGRSRLTQLSLPRSRRVFGPSQVSRQILASPGVNDRLRLLNQETTDLGDRAVNTVEVSDPRMVPVGDSFLYVQSIYVTAQGTGVTRMRLVAVFLNGRIGYGKNLGEALRRASAAPSLRRRGVRAGTKRPREGRDRPALRREDVHRKR
jgi:uncharacterized membrane protein (UPF0182 family)